MRTKILLQAFIFLLTISYASFAQRNPYKEIGKKAPKILTLTNGEYEEFFDDEDVQQIGTSLINIRTNKIVKLLTKEEAEKKLESTVGERFLSVDPLAKGYPALTPYQYAENSPIENLDLDGLEKFNYRLVLAEDNKTVINIVAYKRFDNWLEDILHGQVHRIVDPSSKILFEFEFSNGPELAKFAIGKSVDQLRGMSDLMFQKKVFSAVTYVTAMELEADINKIGNKLSSLSVSGNNDVPAIPSLSKQNNKDAIKGQSQGKSYEGMEFLDDGLRMKDQPLAPQGFKIEGQLSKIFSDKKLFSNWLKGNNSLSRIGNPLNSIEAQQIINTAKNLKLPIESNLKGLQGLERTGQWKEVPHFKVGNVHVPIEKGLDNVLKF